MNTTTHKPYKLNPKQLQLLKVIHKFRFVNSLLLSRYRNMTLNGTHLVLKNLLKAGYIDRSYTGLDKLTARPATYYLNTDALNLLRDEQGYSPKLLDVQRKNKLATRTFVDHNLDVMEAYLNMVQAYPDVFHIFTRPDLGEFDYFLSPAPDLYLKRIDASDELVNDYLVDVISDSRAFIVKKRIEAYIKHFQDGDWEATTKTEYPSVLIVCPDKKTETRIAKQIVRALDSIGEADLLFYTTTTKELSSSNNQNGRIWTQVFEEEELVSLS